MRLNALLMCREQPALRMLAAALEELGIEQEICLSAPEAMERLAKGSYSTLVLDFDLPAASQVARMARLAPAQRRPVCLGDGLVRLDQRSEPRNLRDGALELVGEPVKEVKRPPRRWRVRGGPAAAARPARSACAAWSRSSRPNFLTRYHWLSKVSIPNLTPRIEIVMSALATYPLDA